MKYVNIFLFVLFTGSVIGQINSNISSAVEVSFDDFMHGFLCSTPGDWCKDDIKIVSKTEEREPDLFYGKFFIDNNDSLKLSLYKNSLPVSKILQLFQDNKFRVDSILDLPAPVMEILGLDANHSQIQPGNYKISDTDNNKEIIINFGFINDNSGSKKDETDNREQEIIPPVENRNNKHD